MNCYGKMASYYDELTFDVDYEMISEFIHQQILENKINAELVLDLACGTGSMLLLLSKKGYDVIGIDASAEMLSEAREKNETALLLLQEMDQFELYGTVDVIVCTLDSFNYVTEPDRLRHIFRLIKNYLNPDGLLIFDINSEYKFREILKDNTYSYETDDVFYVWQNDYDEDEGLCDFYLTFFEKAEDGRYDRFEELHTERCYTEQDIDGILAELDFHSVKKFDGYSQNSKTEVSERIVYVCRRAK